MKEMSIKKQLLLTPMNKLGLGPVFNAWFISQFMEQNEVITLQEFIKKNSQAVNRKQKLITWKNDNTKKFLQYRNFTLYSKSWSKLYDFLISKGFTCRDWVLLFPETHEDFDFFQIKQEDLPFLPLFQFANMRPKHKLHLFIQKSILKNSKRNVVLKDVLSFTEKEVACFTKRHRHYKTWLIKLQAKLIFYKLHGSFTQLKIEKRSYKIGRLEYLGKDMAPP